MRAKTIAALCLAGAPACLDAGFEDGIVGDPQLATAETGEKIYGFVVDWCAEIIRREWKASRA